MKQTPEADKGAVPAPFKLISEDYECSRNCRNCPFPGAKCYSSKYQKNTHKSA